MQRRQFGLAIGVATMLVAIGGPAVATSAAAMKPSKVSPPTVIAKTSEIATPQVLVDSKGTVNIIWTGIHGQDTYGDPIPTVMYARKPAGAKAFTRVTLPHVVGDDSYLLFQPSAGVLELLVQAGSNAISAIRSTNDGVSWSTMNAAALNNPNLDNQSIYLEVGSMVAAPQGPIEFTGANAHGATEIIQINPALTTLTPVAADQLSMTGPSIGRTPGGATFEVARYTPSTVPFQVGSHTGQLTFPTCTDATDPSLAVGHSVAVVAETGCGHVWATTISTSGKVGHRETLGVSASQSSGLAGTPWVEAVADRSGHFTVAYVRPGGDLGVARSSNGTKWTIDSQSVPTAPLYVDHAVLSTGAATWWAMDATRVWAIPLDDTYRTPSSPSAHGIPHPRRAHIGSLAVVTPGKVALKHFRKTGRVTVRLVSALADHVSISVGDTRLKGGTVYGICDGSVTAKLKPHRVKTVTVTCASSGVVIGGSAGSGVAAKKGDLLTFAFDGRNGGLKVTGEVA